jgi:fatty acid desaturase
VRTIGIALAFLFSARWLSSYERACQCIDSKEIDMATILLVILILMLLGAIPAWPYSRGWGYYPSGTLTLIIVIVLLLALTGRF